MKETKRYWVSAGIARSKDIPTCFVARELFETSRGAVYLYGHGEVDPQGRCCRCGRTLTHPGSILIGIGPECLGDWGMRDVVLANITPAEVERLRGMVQSRVVDGWLPKGAIKKEEVVDEVVEVPKDHKMLKPRDGENGSSPQQKTAQMDPTGKFLVAKFPYDPKDVENIRTLEGRRWDREKKQWTAWANTQNIEALKAWGFVLCPKLEKVLQPVKKEEVKVDEKKLNLPSLYPFQLDGVKWLESKDGTGLIADEMGLGKTIQALAWLKLHPEKRACIIVPASLKLNWAREIKRWLPGTPFKILSGTTPHTIQNGTRIVIINYDILGKWEKVIGSMNPEVLVVDESHYIKNPKALRTKAVKDLAKRCSHQIFLTGTPITNRPAEFFTTLNLLDPREFPSWFSYVKKYCGARMGRFGWEIGGATHTDELHERLTKTLMIRRRKEDVLKDLPPKRRMVVPIEISNRAVYQKAENDLLGWLKEKFGSGRAEKAAQAEALARFNYLKQLAAEGAREMQVQWIKDSLDTNGKLVVFTVHHATIDFLKEELREYGPVVVDGRVSLEERQKAVDRFQKDENCRVFLGNIKAAGVGLTLTASSNTVFCELGWTPGEHDQAEDRVHRIGQNADSVNAWYLVAERTIMEEMAEILDQKRVVLDAVLDGKVTEEESMLTALLRNRLEG